MFAAMQDSRNPTSPPLFTYIGNGSSINSESNESTDHDDSNERTNLVTDSPGIFYEDFATKLRTSQCPTCRGTGKMTKDQLADLVALIPAADQRLKPRRTVLYLAIAVILCFTASGLTMFFLYPRSITLTLGEISVVNINIPRNKTLTPTITLQNVVNVTNNNYLEVSISSWVIDITWDNYAVAGQVKVGHEIKVPPLKKKGLEFQVVTNYSKNEGEKLRRVCLDNPWGYNMLMIIKITAQVSYLGHPEETSDTEYKYITCTSMMESLKK